MSKPNKQTAAQREAKRLYDTFYAVADYDYINDDDIERIAKKSALIAVDEMENRCLVWADKSDHDTIKDYFKQVRKAIEEM